MKMTHTAIIKYKNPDAIKILKDIGKFLDFTIENKPDSAKNKKQEVVFIDGIACLPPDPKADFKKLKGEFTGLNYAKDSLRSKAWKKNNS
jgi:hypothetical protein